ncbi:MAG TPA: pyridoxal-phosphate dependent enzyme, partial [Saprospiraceae bacterium]|nr:pyridoxal-phosphate dependent enzyme [Saprospiraceae bacterium]
QLKEKTGKDHPDYVIACVGGGSNAAGAFYQFLHDDRVKLILAEAAGKGIDSGHSAATSILGTKGIIHGCMTLLMQTADGQIVEPYSLSAGLDYPGIGPMHAHLIKSGRATVYAATDDEAMQAVIQLSRSEGIIPALETAHALAILDRKPFKKDDNVVVNLSGRGDKDLNTYLTYIEDHKIQL